MHFPKLFSFLTLCLVTTTSALPIATPDTSTNAALYHYKPQPQPRPQPQPQPSSDVRQLVVNAQATIVSLINTFVQSTPAGTYYDSAKSQLSNIAKLTSIPNCPPSTIAPAQDANQAIVALTQTQNSLNQFNLDLVTGEDRKASFCAAEGYFESVAHLSGRG